MPKPSKTSASKYDAASRERQIRAACAMAADEAKKYDPNKAACRELRNNVVN